MSDCENEPIIRGDEDENSSFVHSVYLISFIAYIRIAQTQKYIVSLVIVLSNIRQEPLLTWMVILSEFLCHYLNVFQQFDGENYLSDVIL